MVDRYSLGNVMKIVRLILVIALIIIGIVNIIVVTQVLSGLKMISQGSELNTLMLFWISRA